MGGFGGLFAGLSRGFGGRLLQRADEEREEARRNYERELDMLSKIGFSPDVDPEAAETALRLASERNAAYMKSIGKGGKDVPDFYGRIADLIRKGRTPTVAAQDPNRPSQDTGVPNLFSTEGAHLPVTGQGGPMSPIATGQPAPGGSRGIYRDPLEDKMREVRAVGGYESEQKQIEMNRKKQAIYAEVNAKRMTPEAGARAITALEVGFPLPAERAVQPDYELFTNERGEPQYVAKGGKIPAGYKPYEKAGAAPRAGTFEARYQDRMAQLKAQSPAIGDTEAHQLVMADLDKEDKAKAAEEKLDIQLKQILLAARSKALKDKEKAGGLTAAGAATGLRAARAHAASFSKAKRANFYSSDPAKVKEFESGLAQEELEAFRDYVETVYGMTVEDLQALAGQTDESNEDLTDPYIQQMTGMR